MKRLKLSLWNILDSSYARVRKTEKHTNRILRRQKKIFYWFRRNRKIFFLCGACKLECCARGKLKKTDEIWIPQFISQADYLPPSSASDSQWKQKQRRAGKGVVVCGLIHRREFHENSTPCLTLLRIINFSLDCVKKRKLSKELLLAKVSHSVASRSPEKGIRMESCKSNYQVHMCLRWTNFWLS